MSVEYPDIIGITESWAHEGILDAELSLKGYSLFHCDRSSAHRGGGIPLYVRSHYNPREYHPKSKVSEHVWCQISGTSTSTLLIGVCYKSTSESVYSLDAELEIRNLVDELSSKHFMLMGDFNYPEINWDSRQCTANASVGSKLFLDSVEDNFIKQHVRCPTRQNAVLDLILTDEDDMIDAIESLGPFSSSDHHCLRWLISTGTSGITPHSDGEMCWDYRRADFERFRAELRKTDWRELLGNKIIEGKWAAFKDKLVECEAQFVPKRKCINRRLKPVWMTYRVLKCLKRKHRTFSKYKRVDHPANVKAAKSAKSELCKARRNFETKLAQKIKFDKKSFFAYVRSRTRCRTIPGPLVNRDGTVNHR